MADDDLEQFFSHDTKHDDNEAQTVVAKAKKPRQSKKRKQQDDNPADDAKATDAKEAKAKEEDTTRKRARYFCSNPEQWRCVSRYNVQKMQDWVQDQEFAQQKKDQASILDGAVFCLGSILDTVTAAEGHVKNQILADESLKQAIREEGSEWVNFLNRKIKAAILIAVDVFYGKSDQLRAKPRRESCHVDEDDEEEQAPSGSDVATEQAPTTETTEESEIALSRPDLR